MLILPSLAMAQGKVTRLGMTGKKQRLSNEKMRQATNGFRIVAKDAIIIQIIAHMIVIMLILWFGLILQLLILQNGAL